MIAKDEAAKVVEHLAGLCEVIECDGECSGCSIDIAITHAMETGEHKLETLAEVKTPLEVLISSTGAFVTVFYEFQQLPCYDDIKAENGWTDTEYQRVIAVCNNIDNLSIDPNKWETVKALALIELVLAAILNSTKMEVIDTMQWCYYSRGHLENMVSHIKAL